MKNKTVLNLSCFFIILLNTSFLCSAANASLPSWYIPLASVSLSPNKGDVYTSIYLQVTGYALQEELTNKTKFLMNIFYDDNLILTKDDDSSMGYFAFSFNISQFKNVNVYPYTEKGMHTFAFQIYSKVSGLTWRCSTTLYFEVTNYYPPVNSGWWSWWSNMPQDIKDSLRGIAGKDGVDGTAGVNSVQGQQGMKGEKGDVGLFGAVGPQGEQGVQGTHGLLGSQGNVGSQGTQGIQGEFGLQGFNGTQGLQGTAGLDGKDGADSSSILGVAALILSIIALAVVFLERRKQKEN